MKKIKDFNKFVNESNITDENDEQYITNSAYTRELIVLLKTFGIISYDNPETENFRRIIVEVVGLDRKRYFLQGAETKFQPSTQTELKFEEAMSDLYLKYKDTVDNKTMAKAFDDYVYYGYHPIF